MTAGRGGGRAGPSEGVVDLFSVIAENKSVDACKSF